MASMRLLVGVAIGFLMSLLFNASVISTTQPRIIKQIVEPEACPSVTCPVCEPCSTGTVANGKKVSGPADSSRKAEFDRIFDSNTWGSSESRSGKGSTLNYTRNARLFLGTVIKTFNAKKFLDTPCGDCNWQPLIPGINTIDYLGADIVAQAIINNGRKYRHHQNLKFINLDLVVDEIPRGYDVVLTRDALQHLPVEDGIKLIQGIEKSGAKYFVTNFHHASNGNNYKIAPGAWYPIHVTMPPFNFTPPLFYIVDGWDSWVDGIDNFKMMSVWKLPVLQTGSGKKFQVDLEASMTNIIRVDKNVNIRKVVVDE